MATITSLVTGGAGFLGSHLYEIPAGARAAGDIRGNLETGSLENIRHLQNGNDLRPRVLDITEHSEVDSPVGFVYHLASPASPIDYVRLPVHTLKVGACRMHNKLGLAKKPRAHFLLASTAEVDGDPLVDAQPEIYWANANAIGPRGGYDEVKRYGEALTIAHPRQQGVDTCIVKSSTPTGRACAHQRTRIPTFLRQALVDDLISRLMALAESEVHEPVGVATPRRSRCSRWQSS